MDVPDLTSLNSERGWISDRSESPLLSRLESAPILLSNTILLFSPASFFEVPLFLALNEEDLSIAQSNKLVV